MNTTFDETETGNHLTLRAETAADLMTRNPVSLPQDATICEAAAFLLEREISAAPVIDDAGRPVGVLSHTDIVRHDLDPAAGKVAPADFYHVADLFWPPAVRNFLRSKKPDDTRVRDIMTPTVLHVAPTDTALDVVSQLLALKVHRLFVIDDAGVLVGVISTFDVLRKLRK